MIIGALLVAALIAEGNSPVLCLTILGWMLVTNFGFNLVGGFHNPAGAYILCVTLFTGLLGVFVKAATNEPLVDNVSNADQTLLIYMLGTCATVVAALLSQRFRPKKPFLAGRLTQNNTNNVVIGCLIVGIGLPYFIYMLAPALGSIARQLNITLPLAILIGVYQRVRATGGRSSFSWPVLIAWGYSSWIGLISYSKEGMFAPSLAWLVAAAAARLRVTVLQLITMVPLGIFAIMILVPYSQYGRNFRDETAADPHVAYKMLRHPLQLRDKVNRDAETIVNLYHWYNKPRGIFDRLTLVPIDSALIALTDLQGPIGLQNTFNYFENILPHFILPDKPEIRAGNDYAHEIGMLAPADHTTGISFSPFGDAYHQGGWLGVMIIMPFIQFLMFVSMNYVLGTTDDAPWALFFVMAFAHIAAEGMLSFPVYILSFGMEAVIATAFAMIYLTPFIGSLLLGPGRAPVAPTAALRQPRARVAASIQG